MILVLHQIIFLFNKMYNRTQCISYPNTTLHDQSYKYKTFVHPSNAHYNKHFLCYQESSVWLHLKWWVRTYQYYFSNNNLCFSPLTNSVKNLYFTALQTVYKKSYLEKQPLVSIHFTVTLQNSWHLFEVIILQVSLLTYQLCYYIVVHL